VLWRPRVVRLQPCFAHDASFRLTMWDVASPAGVRRTMQLDCLRTQLLQTCVVQSASIHALVRQMGTGN